MTYDYLIVGAGFAGCVMAERLASAGKRILLIDKRDHIGGNAYDYTNEQGVRIHKYGPHIFHTNSDRVFAYLSRFTEWRPYEHRVLASVEGKLVPFPINLDTINTLYGLNLSEGECAAWLEAQREPIDPIVTAEDQCLATVGRDLYEKFFKGYTTKMWGRPPSELASSVTARIPVRTNRDDRYFTDKHQAMPRDGYTAMFARMVDHPNIVTILNCGDMVRDQWMQSFLLRHPGSPQAIFVGGRHIKDVIWTGPIDEYFGNPLGRLPYRSMTFGLETVWQNPGDNLVTCNWPEAAEPCTRGTNMGLLTDTVQGDVTTMCWELPSASGEPYYPIPAPENEALYKRYEALARETPNVIFLGRLGTYRYFNMDQVVGQALATFEKMKIGEAA